MPSSIPYDPSLTLGNIISQEKLTNVINIAKAQGPADAAENELNSLISMKRSMDMTVQELINMSVDPAALITAVEKVGPQISKAASDYASAKVKSEQTIQPLRAKMYGVSESVESPLDYNRTKIKTDLPLAADTMQLNVQYFSFDENRQDSKTHAATVASFVSGSVSYLGDHFSSQASGSAQNQMNSQYSRHSIAGTLVISISCTHKNALVLAPFILDVDKAIRVWNQLFPSDMIKPDDLASLAKIASQADTPNAKSFNILSGATYGSSFVGMVHVLNTTTSQSNQSMYSVAESMQAQFKIGGWFADAEGGFGVSSSFSNSVKNLLSTQNINSHCTLTAMGLIPSIKSNSVKMAVQQFSDFDGKSSMDSLSTLQNATATQQSTVDSSAEAARTGAQMLSMQNAKIKGVLSATSEIDDGANKMLDINSLMEGMDDYIQKAMAGNIGVPINYYLKSITAKQLAEMYVAKYYPGQYTTESGDDSGTGGPAVAPASGSIPEGSES